jgi:hypothetical protein
LEDDVADPDPQTMIDALTATYTSLAAELATSRSAYNRSETLNKLADVRKELEYWENRRDRATTSSFTQVRPVR